MERIKTPRDAMGMSVLKRGARSHRDAASAIVPARSIRNLRHCHCLRGIREIRRIDMRDWEPGVAKMLHGVEEQRFRLVNRFYDALENAQSLLRAVHKREEELQAINEEMAATNEEIQATNEEMAATNEELQATTEEIRLASAHSRRLIEASLDPLVTIGPDGKITDVNAATEAVTGRPREELIGTDFSDYFTEPETARAGYQQAFKEGLVKDYALELRRRDGHVTPVLYNASVYRNEAGEVMGVFAAARDITEQTRAAQKLQGMVDQLKMSQGQLVQASKMSAVGTMTAGIAHELNNPMMGIMNFIQYCLKHTAQDDRRYTVLEDAERETKRCVVIVENLLKFSHMETKGAEESQKESCATILARVIDLLAYRIETDNILVTRRIAEETPDVWMNINNIQQVFFNVMTNALDAVKESAKKEIQVDMRREGEFVQVIIADTGCGISPENLPRIFDLFFTTKPAGKGLGLGLSTAYSIVKAHGGEITCESEPGAGTKFKILLPVERNTKEETR